MNPCSDSAHRATWVGLQERARNLANVTHWGSSLEEGLFSDWKNLSSLWTKLLQQGEQKDTSVNTDPCFSGCLDSQSSGDPYLCAEATRARSRWHRRTATPGSPGSARSCHWGTAALLCAHLDEGSVSQGVVEKVSQCCAEGRDSLQSFFLPQLAKN